MDLSDEALKRLLDSGHAKGIEAPLIRELRQTRLQLDRTQEALYKISCSCVSGVVALKCQRCAAIESLAFIEKRVEASPKKECCCQEMGKGHEKEHCPGCPVHNESPKHED